MSGNYGLSAPWTNRYREVEALFKEDRQVDVTFKANQIDLFETAFAGNPAVSFIRTVNKGLYGFCSTLYQDIAKDLFCEQSGVFFCTDLPMEEDKETVSES